MKSGTKSVKSSKSGTSGLVFWSVDCGVSYLDSETPHTSFKAKFLKAGSHLYITPSSPGLQLIYNCCIWRSKILYWTLTWLWTRPKLTPMYGPCPNPILEPEPEQHKAEPDTIKITFRNFKWFRKRNSSQKWRESDSNKNA